MWVKYEEDTNIDYSEYLGPDWKAEWDGAPTYISNHTSWLDIMYIVTHFFPGFVAKAEVETTPGVGTLATLLGSVYISRVGDGSKDSKKLIFKSIIDRQNDFMAGKTKSKFCIFPEGSTTNGKYLLSFKKGAFMSLNPVQPMTALSQAQLI
jgi:lysophosphatidylcholine acyltransferase/lyso-PAF acetyltransferase